MVTTRTKRKIIITKLDVNVPEPYITFEVRLPANITKVTGILVTYTQPVIPD